MKKLTFLLTLLISFNTPAFFSNWSIGAGTLTEHVGEIEESIGGETTKFEFNPFFRIQTQIPEPFYFYHDIYTELGISTPRSSRDTAVTELNYWINFNFYPHIKESITEYIRPYYGFGFYFTRLHMDGEVQVLENGGVEQEFQTPSDTSIAGNNVVNLGTDINITKEVYTNLQVMVLNIEDSTERTFNYFISLNINLDSI